MEPSSLVLYEVAEGIATITLNRPDKLNAYTPEMGDATVAAFARARDDDTVRVVILTGAGKAFCAGVDLDRLRAHFAGQSGPGPKLGEEAFVRTFPLELAAFAKPVIAAINGAAYGVGVTMTLPCDVRIASNEAVLGLNFASLGVLPGLGSTHFLPQLIGLPKALELVLSSAKLTAAEAERIGLVQHTVAAGTLMAAARDMAARMAASRTEVLAAAKRALRAGALSNPEQALAAERALSDELNRARSR